VKRPHKSFGIGIGAAYTALTKVFKPFLNTPLRFREGWLRSFSTAHHRFGANFVGL
jgi:hypothetical protein